VATGGTRKRLPSIRREDGTTLTPLPLSRGRP
jgi:hypothetical protein